MNGTSFSVTAPILWTPPMRMNAISTASAMPMMRLSSLMPDAPITLYERSAVSIEVVIVLTCVAFPVPNTARMPNIEKTAPSHFQFLPRPFLM